MTLLDRPTRTETAPRHRPGAGLALGLVALAGVLLVVCFFSITLGSRGVGLSTIWKAFTDFDPASAPETVVREMRVPRTLIGIFAGAALGLSGAILQGVTRNPLADPGIMGLNAGAATFVVFGIMVLGVQSVSVYVWFAFAGAGFATVTVYGIASFGREGATPVKLALAGAAVTAVLSSLTSAIVLTNITALNELRFWQVGSLAGRYMPVFWQTAPFIGLGLLVALGTGRALNGWPSARTSRTRWASGCA
jgi:iron complex transport system permease protein